MSKKQALQTLSLMDGRYDEDEQSNLLCGPVITGITKLAYCNLTIRLRFDSKESLDEARHKTGWEQYDDNTLIISGFNDRIVTKEPCRCKSDEKIIVFYGDWYLEAAD